MVMRREVLPRKPTLQLLNSMYEIPTADDIPAIGKAESGIDIKVSYFCSYDYFLQPFRAGLSAPRLLKLSHEFAWMHSGSKVNNALHRRIPLSRIRILFQLVPHSSAFINGSIQHTKPSVVSISRCAHPTNSLFLFGISSLLKATFSSSSFSFSTRARASGTTSLQRVRKLPGLAVEMAWRMASSSFLMMM